MLRALHVVINSINGIIAFFLLSKYLFHFTIQADTLTHIIHYFQLFQRSLRKKRVFFRKLSGWLWRGLDAGIPHFSQPTQTNMTGRGGAMHHARKRTEVSAACLHTVHDTSEQHTNYLFPCFGEPVQLAGSEFCITL